MVCLSVDMDIEGNFRLTDRADGSVELTLEIPDRGRVDLVFLDEWQFLELVAGQHVDFAKTLTAE